MGLTDEQKKYIKDNAGILSARKLAKSLGVSQQEIYRYLKETPKSGKAAFILPRPEIQKWRRWAWAVFILTLVIYNINGREYSGNDTVPNRYLPFSLLKECNIDFNEFSFLWKDRGNLPYYFQDGKGKILSSSPILPGIINTPFYIIPVLKGLDPGNRTVVDLIAKFSSSFWVACSVVVMLYVFLLFLELRYALMLTLIYAFGTLTWAISSQAAWQHGPSELFLALSLLFSLRVAEGDLRWMPWLGWGLAFATMSRPNDLLIAGIFLVGFLIKYKTKSWPLFAAFAVCIAPFFVYNITYFGSWMGGYARLMSATGATASLYGLRGEGVMSGNMFKGLLGMLFSPSRGIFVYTPCFLFTLWGALRAWKANVWLYRIIFLSIIAVFLWYSRFHAWWAGWSFGLRYSADLVPLVMFLFVFVIKDIFRNPIRKTFFALTVIFSILVQATGAFAFEIGRWNSTLVDVDKRPERLWDWKDSLLKRCWEIGYITPDIILEKRGELLWGAYEFNEMAVELALEEKVNEARGLWEKAVTDDPYFVSAYLNLGIYWANKGERNKAVGYFDKVMSLDPDHQKAKGLLGEIITIERLYD